MSKYFTLIITPPVFQEFDLNISFSESDNFQFLLNHFCCALKISFVRPTDVSFRVSKRDM